MKTENVAGSRDNLIITGSYDLIVCGGGVAAVCCAITAARNGAKVAIVQDRPVLGGNASSEVRLWVLGATSHMGNNNRWAREGGVINEILLENLYRNREGNPILFDLVLIDKVQAEKNITLYLNTAIHSVSKKNKRNIKSIECFNAQNSTSYILSAKLFADCSGDGIVAYNSGASFRMGAEEKDEFSEGFARYKEKAGELLGHSMYFYVKNTGKKVRFIPPAIAHKDVSSAIPRLKNINPKEAGLSMWWFEWGGRLDTVHDTEKIRFELLKVVYGIWDYIKNSGNYPDMDTYTLEWVSTIPGKRESRRFIGYYMLNQNDIVEQTPHYDDVAFGGWSMDLHPADGIYSPLNSCFQLHSKGVYTIPYRCYVSRDLDNLFICGRMASATHVAHGSTRVIGTCSHGAQAAGMAASLCIKKGVLPAHFINEDNVKELQKALVYYGQHIPNVSFENTITGKATVSASSTLELENMDYECGYMALYNDKAVIIPIYGMSPEISVKYRAHRDTTLITELRSSRKTENFSPEVLLESQAHDLLNGEGELYINFEPSIDKGYAFITFLKNENIELMMSSALISSILTVEKRGRQIPPEGYGVEEFDFWTPQRRPQYKNIALKFHEKVKSFSPENLKTTIFRPSVTSNCWIAGMDDKNPWLELKWSDIQKVNSVRLFFDVDYDHPMESSHREQPENVLPYCVREFKIKDQDGNLLCDVKNNYQALYELSFKEVRNISGLRFEFEKPADNVPVALFGIVCL
jgi:FAD dependent oxidoreductase